MVPALILRAYVYEGEVGQVAHEIHGDLAGHGGILAAALATQVCGLQRVVSGRLLDDYLRMRGERP